MSRPPILIGVAWPYANGSLHLGHVAGSLLPPDIFRRYMRMAGHDVLMVSGSDCHGTPILLKAEKEGRTPGEVVAHYHEDHVRALDRLAIGFDNFTTTTTKNHEAWVQEIFLAAQRQGYIEKRTQRAPFDPKAGRFLPDRYVEGICPYCGAMDARGDQCDACGKTLDPNELKEPRSKLNPDTPIEFRDTDHFFFLLSKLQPALERYVQATSGHWRPNAVKFTQNWLREGLQDRAITRDLNWGVPIPLEGYDDKRIYVWFEAVCGYLSSAVEWAQKQGDADLWKHWWTNPDTRSYYFLGKDNIPFHTIIWPAILIAFNEARTAAGDDPLVLPYDVPANEFLNLSGRQFSKSRGVSIDVHDVLDHFDADAIRYYLSVNMPEQRDADWAWDDFLAKVNDELVGIVGNFAHRVLSFTQKNLGVVPAACSPDDLDKALGVDLGTRMEQEMQAANADMAAYLEAVQLKKGMRRLVEYAGRGNQFMQEAAPWKLLKEDRAKGEAALYHLLRYVKGLAVHMAPYLPTAADRLWSMLGEAGSVHDATWSAALDPPRSGSVLSAPQALFRKLDAKDIPGVMSEEEARPGKQAHERRPVPGKGGGTEDPVATDGMVSIEEFARVQLRLATIRSVAEHPKADKLYVLRLDVGELGERQVVAGLKGHYRPEELEGKTVAFVANLRPTKLRGVESQGMILAADDGEHVAVLEPRRALPAGSRIR